MLENGAYVDETDSEFKETPLAIAADFGHLDIVKLLYEHGADINKITSEFFCALKFASCRGNLSIVKYLLENGANPNLEIQEKEHPTQGIDYQDHMFLTPIFSAAQEGHVDVVQELLNFGANPNHFCYDSGWEISNGSPLYVASRLGHNVIVQTLLKHGAEVNLKSDKNKTALQIAIENSHLEVIVMLLENGAIVDEGEDLGKNEIIHKAVAKENLEALNILLKNGATVNGLDSEERTPLHIATDIGNVTIVEKLLEHKANVNLFCS